MRRSTTLHPVRNCLGPVQDDTAPAPVISRSDEVQSIGVLRGCVAMFAHFSAQQQLRMLAGNARDLAVVAGQMLATFGS